ncbi:UvrD-helicase domain-containing protein [Lacinutrix algicola]|uniref:UvrD-helicase domain-containing protein n=1 Tax=Lacinutrix algicola TaxID=342954 RepID=UPI0006E43902|nr:UvrD-helicase domain-containing protein [Lacinutrix algicola]
MTAIEQIRKHIEENKSYVLEAGAGSGKTYTLIQTINYVLETKGESIKLNNQKIVCITYTNVAKNEIIERLENNPLVIVSTIHEFLWDCIKRFNKQLIIELDALNEFMLLNSKKPENYKTRLKDRIKEVTYDDSGYRDFEQGSLHHDDVITLSLQMFKNYTALTHILGQKYPYLFIDEYQDTAIETVDAIINHLLERNKTKLLVGFYGDSYQKIYDEGIGSLQSYIDSNKLKLVTKDDNYRSSESVVKLLNNIRDNITQTIPESKESTRGSVQFINCTNTPKQPKEKVADYKERIAPKKDSDYESIISSLETKGWDFSESGNDKILIIANSKVAERAGFLNLYKLFVKRYTQSAKEALLKRENVFSSYFMGSIDKKTSKERETGIEHLVSFWEEGNYNRVIKYLKQQGVFSSLTKHSDKKEIESKLQALTTIRMTGAVQDVFNFCQENKLSLASRKLQKFIEQLSVDITSITDEDENKRATKNKEFYESLMLINYSEVISVFKHIQEQTSYSTKHGTKGEEYRNVLVVIDDTSWPAQYNFEKFFDVTDHLEQRKLRTKNLFYVSCSRAKENLVVLALSQMGDSAMVKITEWFGNENIQTL